MREFELFLKNLIEVMREHGIPDEEILKMIEETLQKTK